MNLSEIDYSEYAELLIDAGLGLRKGQNLMIRYAPEGILLARECARKAYERGAGIVEMKLDDPTLTKARIDAQTGNDEALKKAPGWTRAWEDSFLGDRWRYLALVSFENPGALKDCDPNAVQAFTRYQTGNVRRFRNAVSAHSFPWTIGAVPGPRWAADVLGDGKTDRDLWEVLKPILLLDKDDPAGAWKEKAAFLKDRSEKLDGLKLESLRFTGEGTDLTVGLSDRARWVGGGHVSDGEVHLPNIPTEEVFTTPDMNRCDGTVRITRPVEVRGTVVKGATLSFENGVLTGFSAEEGQSALEGYVNTDDGARHLGEVALVAEDSPIAASELVFGSILYDENASCHIALGSGYPTCLENPDEQESDEAKLKAGCNVSLVHLDFMIGAADTNVIGIDGNGREVEILRAGRFVI